MNPFFASSLSRRPSQRPRYFGSALQPRVMEAAAFEEGAEKSHILDGLRVLSTFSFRFSKPALCSSRRMTVQPLAGKGEPRRASRASLRTRQTGAAVGRTKFSMFRRNPLKSLISRKTKAWIAFRRPLAGFPQISPGFPEPLPASAALGAVSRLPVAPDLARA
jgi:hypothetical protein